MAASVVRPSVSAGGPRNGNLPVIQHPLARMDTIVDMEITGQSQKSPIAPLGGLGARAKTLMSLSGSTQSLPALSERSSRASTNIELYRDPDVYGTRHPSDKGKFRTSAHLQPKYTTEELIYMIKERLSTGKHGLTHLFQSHDMAGEGRVSRQVLQRILHSLVGYVGSGQFNMILKRLGLEGKQSISCEEFAACFSDNELRKSREWMLAVQRKEIQQHAEEHLRHQRSRGDWVSAPYCLAVLREAAKNNTNGQSVLSLLPVTCAGPDGRVHSLHLYDLITHCGLKIDEYEFAKLWDRFDPQATSAVRLSHFLKVLGLDESGQPRPYTTPRYLLVSKDNQQVVKAVKGPSERCSNQNSQRTNTERIESEKEKEAKVQQQLTDEPVESGPTSEPAEESVKSAPKLRRQASKLKSKTPKLQNIIDCLFHKFEEPYNAMLQGLQVLDMLGDGFVSRVDFKLVLEEYGLKCHATDLEHFLSKCGIRGIRGQINYREFLNKFWNKTETGIVHRIITSKHHVFGRLDHFNPDTRSDEMKSVETLEAKMVEFFHKDFLVLLGALRKCDKYNIGVVTQHEFRDAVERCLGYSMSDKQWAEIKEAANLDSDGLVPYPKFLEQFSSPPGQWNKREVGEFLVRQITTNTMAPALERIKVYSAKCKLERDSAKSESEERTPLDNIRDRIERQEASHVTRGDEASSARTNTGGEGERERANAQEAAEMMAKMLDKPLVNQVSDMKPDPPPDPYTPQDELASVIANGPDRMGTPRGPHQAIAHDHQEKSIDEMNDIVCRLIRSSFHRIDKAFKAIDRKMTGRFHKGQFSEMLQACDIYLSAEELSCLWATLPVSADGMFNFSTLVRHYTDFNRKHVYSVVRDIPIKPELNDNSMAEKHRSKPKERRLSRSRDTRVPVLTRERTMLKDEPKEPIIKIKSQVLGQWEELKNVFRQADQSGASTVPCQQMKDIIKRLNFNLNEEETEQLLNRFDLHNNGSFHYIEFLKMYTGNSHKNGKTRATEYSTLSYRLQNKKNSPIECRAYPTFHDVINRMRPKLVKEWKHVKRAFRKYDQDGKGYLKVSEFRGILESCGVPMTDEDLYYIMSQFDTQMNGKISYEDFLGTLIINV